MIWKWGEEKITENLEEKGGRKKGGGMEKAGEAGKMGAGRGGGRTKKMKEVKREGEECGGGASS